jgi:Fur family ferric uptake transcriptional regulator
MLAEEGILRQLSQSGYRVTRPRRAVIQALLEGRGYSNPAEVYARVRQHCPTVGLVTVYRTLELLSRLGLVRRIHTEEGGCRGYAATAHGHRHHLVCRRCGTAVEFEGCDLEPLSARLSQETGFAIEDHLLELVGVCSDCR